MSRIEDIEAAIDRLAPADFRRIADWVLEKDQQRWDDQLDRDSASGALDFLFDEAEAGEWPPTA